MINIQSQADRIALQLKMQAFPVIGKVPFKDYHWRERSRTTPGVQDADAALWSAATGYALMPVAGDPLYIIDCDAWWFERYLRKEFSVLDRTTAITSGQKGHCNFIVRLSLTLPLPRLQRHDGRQEIASLRGQGSYVVGPGSRHPKTGATYQMLNSGEVVQFDADQTERLLALFDASEPIHVPHNPAAPEGLNAVIANLRARGYRQNGEWLNGRCIHPARHKEEDRHASFGVNIRTGVGYCFLCGGFSPQEVITELGGPLQPALFPPQEPLTSTLLVLGEQKEQANNNTDQIDIELSITTELIRRKCYQIARFFALLWDDSRRHNGQHTYTYTDLMELGYHFNLTRDQVKKALGQMVAKRLLIRRATGVYQRVGVSAARKLLGLADKQVFRALALPHTAFHGSPSEFCREVLAAIEPCLRAGCSTDHIAATIGYSRRSIYTHENALGIQRTPVTIRVGTAPASAPHFVKVFKKAGEQQEIVGTYSDCFDGIKVAVRLGGKVWGWRQLPSIRYFGVPNLHTYTFFLERENEI